MLGRLARLLRAAGEDVTMADSAARDGDLLATARREGRRLLTRDRQLAAAAGVDGLRLLSDRLMDQATEVARAAAVDWRRRRFTRCLVDNSVLDEAAPERLADLPGDTRDRPGPFRVCPACGRLYWPGSHIRRLAERLDRIADAAARDL